MEVSKLDNNFLVSSNFYLVYPSNGEYLFKDEFIICVVEDKITLHKIDKQWVPWDPPRKRKRYKKTPRKKNEIIKVVVSDRFKAKYMKMCEEMNLSASQRIRSIMEREVDKYFREKKNRKRRLRRKIRQERERLQKLKELEDKIRELDKQIESEKNENSDNNPIN